VKIAGGAEASTGGLEIRIAGSEDAGSLRGLVASFRDHLQAAAPADSELDAQLSRALSDPSIEFACARLGGRAVGYSQTRFFFSLWASGLEALLEDLFVLSDARGLGIGRALLRHALRRAGQRGARLLGLTTNERNRRAQALYRSEGLEPQGAKLFGNGREVRWIARLEGFQEARAPGSGGAGPAPTR
jgi:ribosomal protein S18 acetylase RimI-like enzyme